jgi:flagellar basal-body rod modification protein FlgD
MATVGLFPPSASSTVDAANNSGSGSDQTSNASDPLANKSTFLQLLVAQLKNQNPAQPLDGTTFVTQLAQFSDLEQNLAMRQDLDAVSEKYLGTTAPPSDGSSSTSSTANQ